MRCERTVTKIWNVRAVVAGALILVILAGHPAAESAEPTVPAAVAPAPGQIDPSSDSDPFSDIDPSADLPAHYAQAGEIEVAIVVVPDPRVPRYRRLYDLSLEAIQIGMLAQNYVLDRWSLPWPVGDGSDAPAEEPDTSTANAPPADVTPGPTPHSPKHSDHRRRGADSRQFGLLIYRCDGWREPCRAHIGKERPHTGEGEDESGRSLLRALYVVPEMATKGVEFHSLYCAFLRVKTLRNHESNPTAEELSRCPPAPTATHRQDKRRPPVRLLSLPECAPPQEGDGALKRSPTLLVLGPNLSGSLDSVRRRFARLTRGGDDKGALSLCLVSASATAPSNAKVFDSLPQGIGDGANGQYHTLALTDEHKLDKVDQLAQTLPLRGAVVFLSEASTFGYAAAEAVCTRPDMPADKKSPNTLCSRTSIVYFPPTIADIHYSLVRQQQRDQSALSSAARKTLPSDHLFLDLGADNGSEFPDNHQSELTLASLQLSLDRAIAEVTNLAPSAVIVVATDVRDRLFLFEQLRARMPAVTLVDLESDALLAHPDFLHASRGAITLASAQMVHWTTGELTGRLGSGTGLYGCEDAPTNGPTGTASPADDGSATPLKSWPTDVHAMLSDAVSRLDFAHPPCIFGPKGPRQPILNVVTLHGLEPVSQPYTGGVASGALQPLHLLEVYVPLMFLVLPLVWLQGLLPASWNATAPILELPSRRPLLTTLALVIPLLIGAAWLAAGIGWNVRGATAWCALGVMVLLGTAALVRCVHRMNGNGIAHGSEPPSDLLCAGGAALLGIALATVPLLWRFFDGTLLGTFDEGLGTLDEGLLAGLALDLRGGLAFLGAVGLAAAVLLGLSVVLATTSRIIHRDLGLIKLHARDNIELSPGVSAFERHGLVGPPYLPVLTALVIIVQLLLLGGVNHVIFGAFASWTAFLALAATTFFAAVMLSASLSASYRLRSLSALVRARLLTKRPTLAQQEEVPGLWRGGTDEPVKFAVTPISVRVPDAGKKGMALLTPEEEPEKEQYAEWKKLLNDLLANGIDDASTRGALFVLLALEMSLFRWLVAATLLATLGGVVLAYLFPMQADILILLNLGLLTLAGLLLGYMSAMFEGDGVLSNVLCNRPRKARWSVTLFAFVTAPFLVLVVAITIAQMPGVIQWSGGLLELVNAVGVH
jgi:hypothetical protein